MSTKISELRPFLRALLGDVQNMGVWGRDDTSLDSAVRTVIATRQGPAGYALSATGTVAQMSASDSITPALDGIPLARLLNATALLIATTMSGSTDIRTRSLTVKEGAERKLAMMIRFREEVERLDAEGSGDGSGIASRQGLCEWLIANNGGEDAWGLASTMVFSGGQTLSL